MDKMQKFGKIFTKGNKMKNLKEFFKKKIEIIKAAQKAARVAEVESLYRLKEKDGKLYVTCNGLAIYEIADDCNAKTIAEILAETRKIALKFVGIAN